MGLAFHRDNDDFFFCSSVAKCALHRLWYNRWRLPMEYLLDKGSF